MATLITKNSSTAAAAPLAADLTQGELAVNVTDKKLYSKDSGGAVVKLVGGLGNQEANAVAITGGAVNGTTVGATTATTGAFTTLAASGAVTLSGGTANGVTYLNGSKVLTSGSALTFDGTALTVNTSSSGIPLVVNGTGNTGLRVIGGTGAGLGSYLSLQAQGGNAALVGTEAAVTGAGTSTNLMLFGYGSNSIIFAPSTAEVGRFTSTGLGIGTSSPDSKLVVSAYTGGSYNTAFNNSGQNNFIVQGTSGYTMFRKSDGTELARFNTVGLGLGTSTNTSLLGVNGVIQVTSGGNPSSGAGLEIGYGTVTASRTALQSYNRTGSAYLGADYNALDHYFYTSGTERARITTGGFFKASTTGGYAGGSSHEFRAGIDGNYAVTVTSTASSPFGFYVGYTAAAPSVPLVPLVPFVPLLPAEPVAPVAPVAPVLPVAPVGIPNVIRGVAELYATVADEPADKVLTAT